MTIKSKISHDGYVRIDISNPTPNSVRISLVAECDGTGKWVDLDGADVEGLIGRLSEARAKLMEQVPRTLEPNAIIGEGHLQTNPDWHFHDSITWKGEKLTGVTPLALRHEGLGWLYFAFPNGSADIIGKSLVKKSAEGN